jgi:hypothetical protein
MDTTKWLSVAEVLDSFRVIPRLILVTTYTFVGWYTYKFTEFYFQLINQPEVSDWKLSIQVAIGANRNSLQNALIPLG